MTSFSLQNPLKLKNKKHAIVRNTKFCHPENIELNQIKTAKVVPNINGRLRHFVYPAFCARKQ